MLKIPYQSNFSELLLLIHITSIFSNVSFQYKKSPGKQIFLLNRRFSVKAASSTWRASTTLVIYGIPYIGRFNAASGTWRASTLLSSKAYEDDEFQCRKRHLARINHSLMAAYYAQCEVSMPQAAFAAHQQIL